jgi:S-adenosyl-L-methionine hydrolase (adenosine-forming)
VLVTFLSDFGLEGAFVGTCHGVIKRIAPDAEIIDLTHGIAPRAVLQGALVLASALPYMPVGVHLAVVDPGVGGGRRAVVLRGKDARLHVGPDNGLLIRAAERLGGVAGAWELTNRTYWLEPVSATFHGRDVFAPAAAHLARGLDPAELGPPVDPSTLVHVEVPVADVGESEIHTMVLAVDRFGNAQLNLEHPDLVPGTRAEIDGRAALVATTFADAAQGELILYEDSAGFLAIAVNGGSAAEALALLPGQPVVIRTTS